MAPFKLCKDNIFHIQSNIIIALVPIIIWGIFVFGARTLILLSISIVFSLLTELAFCAISKNINSFSPILPIITGTLSCLILPVSAPLWVSALGAILSSTFSFISLKGKSFGTLINPISASGIILYGLFEKSVNNFTAPFEKLSPFQFSIPEENYITTLLKSIKNGTDSITDSTLLNTFLGRDSGAIGEVSTLLILICGIYLIFKKYISWHIPVTIISTVFLISFFYPVGNCEAIYCAAIETLSGGVFFYSFFVAALPASSPITQKGKIIFGVCTGIIIMALRRFTPVVDGTLFAVGAMSCFTQIIDHFTGNNYFSYLSDLKKDNQPAKTDLESLLKDD